MQSISQKFFISIKKNKKGIRLSKRIKNVDIKRIDIKNLI
jgi:hypothetical protein